MLVTTFHRPMNLTVTSSRRYSLLSTRDGTSKLSKWQIAGRMSFVGLKMIGCKEMLHFWLPFHDLRRVLTMFLISKANSSRRTYIRVNCREIRVKSFQWRICQIDYKRLRQKTWEGWLFVNKNMYLCKYYFLGVIFICRTLIDKLIRSVHVHISNAARTDHSGESAKKEDFIH